MNLRCSTLSASEFLPNRKAGNKELAHAFPRVSCTVLGDPEGSSVMRILKPSCQNQGQMWEKVGQSKPVRPSPMDNAVPFGLCVRLLGKCVSGLLLEAANSKAVASLL